MVRPNSETGALNLWAEREDGQNHYETFLFGILVPSFNIRERTIPVTDDCPVGRIGVVLLLQKAHPDLISRGIRVKKEGSVCYRKFQNGRFNEGLFEHLKFLKLVVRRIEP